MVNGRFLIWSAATRRRFAVARIHRAALSMRLQGVVGLSLRESRADPTAQTTILSWRGKNIVSRYNSQMRNQ